MIYLGKEQRLSKHQKDKILARDKYTCMKCKIENKTARKLEVHHITPLTFGGNNDKRNLITLCRVCHKYAPNNKEEFAEYMDSELDGVATTLINIYKKMKESGELEQFDNPHKIDRKI